MNDGIKYLDSLSLEMKRYFEILCSEFPEWIIPYIYTPEMLRLKDISQACGRDYIKLYNYRGVYNVLEHSIGCALIVWNFTKDKKQTLSALFHDISTPVFKHCIDFLDGDYEKQESTEDLTIDIIRNSEQIMKLLKRDGIKLEEVCDYHLYPIADNDSPRLSSDRLEYTFMYGYKLNYEILFSLADIKKIYDDLEIQINEEGTPELGFKTLEIAEKFVCAASILWPKWCDNRNKLVTQFYADIIKRLIELGEISSDNLYKYSEDYVIWLLNNSSDKDLSSIFKLFQETMDFYESDVKPSDDKYFISFNCKKRYLNPLVNINGEYKRIYDVSKYVKYKIDDFLSFKTIKYAYFDFNFIDENNTLVKRKKLY